MEGGTTTQFVTRQSKAVSGNYLKKLTQFRRAIPREGTLVPRAGERRPLSDAETCLDSFTRLTPSGPSGGGCGSPGLVARTSGPHPIGKGILIQG